MCEAGLPQCSFWCLYLLREVFKLEVIAVGAVRICAAYNLARHDILGQDYSFENFSQQIEAPEGALGQPSLTHLLPWGLCYDL